MLSAFTNPSDTQLFEEVRTLSHRERQATARLIACLAEVDARRLYRGEGCSSLFTYCTQILHLSEHAAYMRIEAARAARRFPVILASASASERQSPIVLPPRPPKRPAVMAPIAPEQYKIQMTVSRDTYEKLRRAQDLIRHMVPNADPAAIFERALTLFFVGSRNGGCTERAFLEFHHVLPHAAGGRQAWATFNFAVERTTYTRRSCSLDLCTCKSAARHSTRSRPTPPDGPRDVPLGPRPLAFLACTWEAETFNACTTVPPWSCRTWLRR
jgi:hypothetical protein